MILFSHIEKCGGTSIHSYLRKKINNYCVLKPTPSHGKILRKKQLDRFEKIFPKIRGFGSHRIRPFEDYGDEKILITVIRDPIERYFSHMRHQLERGIISHKDRFIDDTYFDNFMCRKISGTNSFSKTRELIDSKKIIIFIIENEPHLERKNIAKDKASANIQIEGINRNLIKEKNKEDIKLHNWVKSNHRNKLDDYFTENSSEYLGKVAEKYIQNIIQPIIYLVDGDNPDVGDMKRGY